MSVCSVRKSGGAVETIGFDLRLCLTQPQKIDLGRNVIEVDVILT